MKKIRYLLEYAGLRVALWAIDGMSLTAAEKLASFFATVFFRLHASRRRTAIENILLAGIAPDGEKASAIALASFRHFAILVVESLRSSEFIDETNWQSVVTADIHPDTLALLREPGRGILLVSGHLGNWEIAVQVLSFIKPVVGLTRNMNNPYSDRLMKARKPRNRFRLEPKHSTESGRFVNVLKNGEVLALLADQHANDRGMPIEFFGRPASTYTSPALLHLVTRAPLVFGTCVKTGPRRYLLKADAPLSFQSTGNKEKDIRAILEIITGRLEQAIRAHPDQYMWAHRRWRIQPIEPPRS